MALLFHDFIHVYSPWQGKITSDDKFLSYYRTFVTAIIFVKFHNDSPNS